MVIHPSSVICQTPVVFPGKVGAMIQQTVHGLRHVFCPVLLVEDNAVVDKFRQWIVIGNSHKNHSGTQEETNVKKDAWEKPTTAVSII